MIREVFGAPLWARTSHIVIFRPVPFLGPQEQSFEQQAGHAKTALHATPALSWDMQSLILPVGQAAIPGHPQPPCPNSIIEARIAGSL